MANFNIKEVRGKMVEAGRKIEAMSAQMDTLKQKKEQLLEARTELEGANIDEESKELLREAVSSMIERTETEAENLSDQISEQTGILEEGMQETQEAEAETASTRSSMEKRASFLESIGAQGMLEGSIDKLTDDLESIEALKSEIIEMRKKGEDAQRIASTMGN